MSGDDPFGTVIEPAMNAVRSLLEQRG